MEEILQNTDFWTLVISLVALVVSIFRPQLSDSVEKIKRLWLEYIEKR